MGRASETVATSKMRVKPWLTPGKQEATRDMTLPASSEFPPMVKKSSVTLMSSCFSTCARRQTDARLRELPGKGPPLVIEFGQVLLGSSGALGSVSNRCSVGVADGRIADMHPQEAVTCSSLKGREQKCC